MSNGATTQVPQYQNITPAEGLDTAGTSCAAKFEARWEALCSLGARSFHRKYFGTVPLFIQRTIKPFGCRCTACQNQNKRNHHSDKTTGAWRVGAAAVTISPGWQTRHRAGVMRHSRRALQTSMAVWPSGLRRWLQAPARKGVGPNPTAVTLLAHATSEPKPPFPFVLRLGGR